MENMSGFDGKAFLLGIQHLDVASRELFDTHGNKVSGHSALLEAIGDEAMLRLVGADFKIDPYRSDRRN